MTITIKYTNLDSTPSLETFITQKLAGVEKFLKNLDPDHLAELHVEVARTTRHHHKGPVFRAAGQLKIPKKVFRASADAEDARVAVDRLRDVLREALERHKARTVANKK